MSQIILLLVRSLRRLRTPKYIFLIFMFATMNGCATTRLLWEQVPAKRWTYKKTETSSVSSKSDPIDEPSMAANVAVKSVTENEPEVAKPGTNYRSKLKSTRSGIRLHHSTARLSELTAASDTNSFDEKNPDSASDADHADSSMNRLNAALSDDAMQVQTLPQHSLTTLEARIRVDLLIARARQLLEIRQFDQALGSAKLAQELAETTQLDFSPEEDRPIDLVRQIEGQLEAQQLADQAVPKIDSEDPTTSTTATSLNDNQQKTSTQEAEKPKTSRIRREWSNLFRRDKKQAIAENEPISHDSKPGKAALNSAAAHENFQANFNAGPSSRDGIVVANRSVALGNLESADLPGKSFVGELTDEPPVNAETLSSTRVDNSFRTESDRFDERDRHDANPGLTRKSKIIRSESDDNLVPQPEFEMGEPAGPSREIETGNEESPRVKFDDSEDANRKSDWTTFYVIFGVCSLLALACYRRGTI